MSINTEHLKTKHISHTVLKSVITKKDFHLLKSSEIKEHLKSCSRCSEIIEIIKDAQQFAGQTKPDSELGHPSRLYLNETITRVYDQSLSAQEAANFLHHLETCSQCFNYVELVLEDSLTPLPENVEQELALYSKISIAEQALGLVPSHSVPTVRWQKIWGKVKSISAGILEPVTLRPAVGFALLILLIIGLTVGQSQLRTWRAGVYTKAGMNLLREVWTITDDDLRPSGNFPMSIFSITHGPGWSEAAEPAREDFASALKWDKNNKAAKRGLAIYWCFTGHLEHADSLLGDLLEQDNMDYESWNLLGLVAARRDNITTALNAFERALEIRPDYPEAAYNRAMILQQVGRLEEAKKAWKDYLRIDSQSEWSKVAEKILSSFR
ncbi:MAG: tetratricopeptide repeat protein [bacterium]